MEIVTNIIRAVVFFNSVYMPFFILYRHFDSYGALKDFNNIIIEQVCKVIRLSSKSFVGMIFFKSQQLGVVNKKFNLI